jgi:putative FmdB family regulatory protein
MPLYDFRCKDCSEIFERFAGQRERICTCNACGCEQAYRIVSVGRSAYRPDASWIASVLEVVDKEDKDPATRAFVADPNRHNYHAWMKAKGLRPMAENEFRNPRMEKAIEEVNHRRTRLLLKQKRERETINVRGK